MSHPWPQELRDRAIALAKQGKSAGEIGRTLKVTRNAAIGIISRHAPRPVKKDKETAKSAGSLIFVGPSKPRRFSWEEGV